MAVFHTQLVLVKVASWWEKFLGAGNLLANWKKNLGKILKLNFFAVLSCFGKNCNIKMT